MAGMYCDYEDLVVQVDEGALLEAADMTAPPGDPQSASERDTVTPSIINASAEVAGYLARRYKLPSSPVEAPAMLRKLAADIAIYNIFSRKGFDFSEEVRDHIIVRRYREAIEYLKAVADEDADIDGLEEEKEADGDEEEDDGNYGGAHIWLYRS